MPVSIGNVLLEKSYYTINIVKDIVIIPTKDIPKK